MTSSSSWLQAAYAFLFPAPVTLRDRSKELGKQLLTVERGVQRRMARAESEMEENKRDLVAMMKQGQEPSVFVAKRLLRLQDAYKANEKRLEVLASLKNQVDTLADSVDLVKSTGDATRLVRRVNQQMNPGQATNMAATYSRGVQQNSMTQDAIQEAITAVADDQQEDLELEVAGSDPRLDALMASLRDTAGAQTATEQAKKDRLAALRRQRLGGGDAVTVADPHGRDEEAAAQDDLLRLRMLDLESMSGK
jgi:hypothetical protein